MKKLFRKAKTSLSSHDEPQEPSPRKLSSTLRKSSKSNEVSKYVKQINDNLEDPNTILNIFRGINLQMNDNPELYQALADKNALRTFVDAINNHLSNINIRVEGMKVLIRLFKDRSVQKKAAEAFCEKDTLKIFLEIFVGHYTKEEYYLHSIECLSEFTFDCEYAVKKISASKFTFNGLNKTLESAGTPTGSFDCGDLILYIIYTAKTFKSSNNSEDPESSKKILQHSARAIYNLIHNDKKLQEALLKSGKLHETLTLLADDQDLEYEACRIINDIATNFDVLSGCCGGKKIIIDILNHVGKVEKDYFCLKFCDTLLSFIKTSDANGYKDFAGLEFDTLINVITIFVDLEEVQIKAMSLIETLCTKSSDFSSFFYGNDNVKRIIHSVQRFPKNKSIASSFEAIIKKYSEIEFNKGSIDIVLSMLSHLSTLERSDAFEKVYDYFLPMIFEMVSNGFVLQNDHIKMFFDVLGKYKTSSIITDNILNMLSYILENNSDSIAIFGELKGSISIIASVINAQNSSNVLITSCKILSRLVDNQGCLLQVHSSGIAEKIAGALVKLETDEDAQRNGIHLFLTLLNKSITREKIDTEKIVSVVTKAFNTFKDNKEIENDACTFISEIAKSKQFVVDNKGAKRLIELICENQSDELLETALSAFANISTHVKKENLPQDSCGSPSIISYMIRNIEDTKVVQKSFAFLKVVVELFGDDIGIETLSSIITGVRLIIVRYSIENLVKIILDTCVSIAKCASKVTFRYLQDFNKDFVPVIKLIGDKTVMPEIKSFCCCVLAQVDFAAASDDILNELITGIKITIENNQSEDNLVDCCCLVLKNIGLSNKDEVKAALVKSDIYKNLSFIATKRPQPSASILSALEVFIGVNEKFNLLIWFKISSQILLWINKNKENSEVLHACFDFLKRSLEHNLKYVKIESINYLLSFVLIKDSDDHILDAGKLLLPLLRLRSIENKPLLTEAYNSMLENLYDTNKLIYQLNDVQKWIDGQSGQLTDIQEVLNSDIEQKTFIFVDILFVAMLYHKKNVNIQKVGLDILRKNVGDAARMKSLHMLEFVVSIMKWYKMDVEILERGVYVLKRLVPFLGYGKTLAIETISDAKIRLKDKKICDDVLKEVQGVNLLKYNMGPCQLPFKLSEDVFCTKDCIIVESLKALRELDATKISELLVQLGILESNVIENNVDGNALLDTKSQDDLAKLCGITPDDVDKVIDFINGVKNNDMNKARKYVQEGSDSEKSSIIECYKKMEHGFYKTLEESLKIAKFMDVKSLMKYSREMAVYLESSNVLEKLSEVKGMNITQADAMALAIYTYDNGPDNFEENPFRKVNKAFIENDKEKIPQLKWYVLRLLTALRKLPAYKDTETLYRAVTNVSSKYKEVGSILSWPAFTSTSSDEISVIDFLNSIVVDGERYILEITGCFDKGHSIKDFSFHSDEDEILFEPETKFKIIEVKPDPKVDGVTRIHVEIQPTDPVLADVVENFMKMCEKNIRKENDTNEHNTKKEGAAYKGPVVPKDEWHDFWNDVEKSQKEYMSLKRALEFMVKNDLLREMLVDGYKRAIIDDDYCDGAEMMKGYEISVEEGAALYSCTHKYGEEGSPSWAVGRMVSEWVRNREGGIDPHGTNYLLHVASSLEKLPLWGVSMDDDKPDDKDGNEPDSKDDDDDEDNKLDDDEPKETKRIYLCMKKEDLKELECGKEYVIGSVFAGSVERPSAGKGECVVCVEDAQNLCVREVGPLSAWNMIGYVLGLPGAHIAVKSIPPSLNDDNDDDDDDDDDDDENDVIVRAVPMSPEEKSECDACIKHFISLLPLPEGWSVETDDDTGRTFYQNNITDEAQWAKPVIEDPRFFTDFRQSFSLSDTDKTQTLSSPQIDLLPENTNPQQIDFAALSHGNNQRAFADMLSKNVVKGANNRDVPPHSKHLQQRTQSLINIKRVWSQNICSPQTSFASLKTSINLPPQPGICSPQASIISPRMSFISPRMKVHSPQSGPMSPPYVPAQTQQLPPNWLVRTDPKTGRTYYANTVTKKTQWEFPSQSGINVSASFDQQTTQFSPGIQYLIQKQQQCSQNVDVDKTLSRSFSNSPYSSTGSSPSRVLSQSNLACSLSQNLGGSANQEKSVSSQSQCQTLQYSQSMSMSETSSQGVFSPQSGICSPQASIISPRTSFISPRMKVYSPQSGPMSPPYVPAQTQQLPPNWSARTDPKTGRIYYANTVTKKTQWEFPIQNSISVPANPALQYTLGNIQQTPPPFPCIKQQPSASGSVKDTQPQRARGSQFQCSDDDVGMISIESPSLDDDNNGDLTPKLE